MSVIAGKVRRNKDYSSIDKKISHHILGQYDHGQLDTYQLHQDYSLLIIFQEALKIN
jgi:hypothetical protein